MLVPAGAFASGPQWPSEAAMRLSTSRYKGGMRKPTSSEQPTVPASGSSSPISTRQHLPGVRVVAHCSAGTSGIAVPAQAACATASPATVHMHGGKREEGHASTHARRHISSRAHTRTCTQVHAHKHATRHARTCKYAHACASGHLHTCLSAQTTTHADSHKYAGHTNMHVGGSNPRSGAHHTRCSANAR